MEIYSGRRRRSSYFAVSWEKIRFSAYGSSDCHDDSCWIINYSTCWQQEHLDYNGDYVFNGTHTSFH